MMSAEEDIHRRGAEDAEAPQRGLTQRIIAAAIEVHRELGPGLLESVYQDAMCAELESQSIRFECQRAVPVTYKGRQLAHGLRLDLVVEDAVIVEIKSVQGLTPIDHAQLLTYLRLTDLPVGLLLNFNQTTLVKGVKRISNSLRSSAPSAPLR
jgi:GxxExxY protein